PRHSSRASGTAVPEGRGTRCVGRPRSRERADRARRTRPDDPPCDGRRRGRRDNRSIFPLAVVPTPCASFRLLTLACRSGILCGSDGNNNMLRNVTGVKMRRYSRYIDGHEFLAPKRLPNGLYIEVHAGTSQLIDQTGKMLEYFQIPKETLKI